MKRFSFIVLLLLITSDAQASPQPLERYAKYGTVIDGLDLSASRSFAINMSPQQLGGVWGLMVVWIEVTDADNSVTALNISCTASHDGGATDFTIQDCTSVTAGVCTSAGASWTKNPSAITSPKRWPWRADIEGFPEVECTITDTGGDASDTIKTVVTFATKG